MKKKANNFYDMFVGEHVTMILDKSISTTNMTESGVETEETPMIQEGYLVGMDDDYFFVGNDMESVSWAIKRSVVLLIAVSEPDEEIPLANKMEMN